MTTTPRRPGARSLAQWIALGFRAHVIVKFEDQVTWPGYADGAERHFEGALLEAWNGIRREYPGVTFQRLFPALAEPELEELRRHAMAASSDYEAPRLQNCFAVECPPERSPQELAGRLARMPRVETAYVEGPPAPPPTVQPADDPLSGYQGYLGKPPRGVAAAAAWPCAGGDGAGVWLADVEEGWYLQHPDLPAPPALQLEPAGYSVNFRGRSHGTNVLGVVMAADNEQGCIGIVPGVRGCAVSEWWRLRDRPEPGSHAVVLGGVWFSRAQAIAYAAWRLRPGDVMLLETQVEICELQPDGETCIGYLYPAEFEEVNRQLIRLATQKGIVVVEAAGNGAGDLDAPAHGRPFQRGPGDSGAILVAGAEWIEDSTRGGFQPASDTNFGSRVDCFSWGRDVVTLGNPDVEGQTLTEDDLGLGFSGAFNGTSSASAIVAGCAAAVQGIARAKKGRPLLPLEVRRLLGEPTFNTRTRADAALPPSQSADRIGVQPRLDHVVPRIV